MNRHETPFAMSADILREDVASSSIPQDSSHQTGDTRSTSFYALPAFDHSQVFVEHTRKQSPSCTSRCTSFEITKKNEVTCIERNLSIPVDGTREREELTETITKTKRRRDRKNKSRERTTEIPSSAFAQRLAPDTSTLPTTPQPPPYAGQIGRGQGNTKSDGEDRARGFSPRAALVAGCKGERERVGIGWLDRMVDRTVRELHRVDGGLPVAPDHEAPIPAAPSSTLSAMRVFPAAPEGRRPRGARARS